MIPINIFYQEPNPDRWVRFDRYPRSIIRQIIRGKPKPGGIMMVALQLMQGLDKINYPYRFNDFGYARRHPDELVCIIGKPQLLFNREWKNPILFGPGTFSHPLDCPDLFTVYPNVKKCLVACDWMSKMFEPFYGKNKMVSWPVGIDTEKWNSNIKQQESTVDFLIYDKIRWEYDYYNQQLLSPIIRHLNEHNLTYDIIRYGHYNHEAMTQKLAQCKAVIFLCEHETQGLACEQMLSTNTPMLVWDRQGYWQDPAYFPHKVKFEPVTPVPYWSDDCGMKFKDASEFSEVLPLFLNALAVKKFAPRRFILENLTLEICAHKFVEIVNSIIA